MHVKLGSLSWTVTMLDPHGNSRKPVGSSHARATDEAASVRSSRSQGMAVGMVSELAANPAARSRHFVPERTAP